MSTNGEMPTTLRGELTSDIINVALPMQRSHCPGKYLFAQEMWEQWGIRALHCDVTYDHTTFTAAYDDRYEVPATIPIEDGARYQVPTPANMAKWLKQFDNRALKLLALTEKELCDLYDSDMDFEEIAQKQGFRSWDTMAVDARKGMKRISVEWDFSDPKPLKRQPTSDDMSAKGQAKRRMSHDGTAPEREEHVTYERTTVGPSSPSTSAKRSSKRSAPMEKENEPDAQATARLLPPTPSPLPRSKHGGRRLRVGGR